MALCELMKEGHCSGEAARAGLSSHAWLASRWHCMNEHTGYRLYLIYASIYIGVSFAAGWVVGNEIHMLTMLMLMWGFILGARLRAGIARG
jgi:hypothetical protein